MTAVGNTEAVAAIDDAVAVLLARVDALRTARAILAGDAAPAPGPTHPAPTTQAPPPSQSAPAGRPSQPTPEAGSESRGSTPAGREQSPESSRSRRLRPSTLEFHAQLRKLLGEGVFDVGVVASRLGRSVQGIYQGLSDAGLSLRKARAQWEASRGVLERGPDPLPPAPATGSPAPVSDTPGKGSAARLDFGGVVFVRRVDPLDLAKPPTYLRCTVVSLPGEDGEFTVKGPAGESIALEVGDAVAPFRDDTPTFRLGAVEGGEEPAGTGEPDAAEEVEAETLSRVQAPSSEGRDAVGVPRVTPFGSSFDFDKLGRSATVPELRAEAVKRQRGCSGKAVQFATSLADGHAHVASVDRMGYGSTVKDASGHVHRLLKWEVLPAAGVHAGRHGLTLSPPTSGPNPPGDGGRTRGR